MMSPGYISFSKQRLISISLLLVLICFSTKTYAKSAEPSEAENFFDMSLEELMEIPVIVSAPRRAQKISELSVPVSVISEEDIHYSGLTSIPEILRFAPGVDVLQFDRNRYAVGVRGIHDHTSDRTIVLINGRIANNPVFGGVEWNTLPILIEDIKRIEILRGPGGAAAGANAFTGVINIITKKPQDIFGYFGSTTINEFGDTYTHLRWADKKDKWSWRISAGYEDRESSDDAGAGDFVSAAPAINPLIGFNSYSARDFCRNWRFDAEAIYNYSENTKWSFGAGYSNLESGDWEFLGYFPKRDILISTTRVFSRVDHIFDDESSAYLQWFGNYSTNHCNVLADRYSTTENDIEGQLDFTVGDKHDISLGGNLRLLHINLNSQGNLDATIHGEPIDERWAGLFAIDRYHASERLTLEGQLRADWYSETHRDWSARASALYALDEAKDHIARFSIARAFRAPLSSYRKGVMSRVPVGPLYFVNVLTPDGDLKNEHTWSIEAGYTGRISEGLTLRLDSYYQRFENILGSVIVPSMVPGVTNYRVDNIDGATSYGAECELAVENNQGKFAVWYAYNDFSADQTNQDIRAFRPAKHKAGLTFRLHLPEDWTFNTNYSYSNVTQAKGSLLDDASTSNNLDLTIAKRFANKKGEIMIGVSNVLNKTIGPTHGSCDFTAHDVPGRTFFARLQLKF